MAMSSSIQVLSSRPLATGGLLTGFVSQEKGTYRAPVADSIFPAYVEDMPAFGKAAGINGTRDVFDARIEVAINRAEGNGRIAFFPDRGYLWKLRQQQ